MTFLITGGAGFIGSNFIRYFLHKHPSYRIINLDKLTYAGNLENLRDLENNLRYRFIKGDICEARLVDKLAKEVDTIINFAAESHVDRSLTKADDFIKTNLEGTYVLLKAALKHRHKKFLHISTDEVYGSVEKGAFREDSPLKPSSPYSASKAAADLLALSYFISFNLPVLITRSSNNFGPYQYPEKFIPLFITQALQDKSLPLYGDGKNVRDWIYVEENCAAIDLVLHKGENGEIYNIGGNNEKKNIEIVHQILQTVNKPRSLINYVTDRLGHDRRYALNCEKIHRLGYQSFTNFEQTLAKTIEWYQENESWWKRKI